MCQYLEIKNKGYCKLLNNQCPYVYFCTKQGCYREQKNFPTKCKLIENAEIPQGYYKVCFEKRGNLYVDYNGHIEIVRNPFEEVPKFVKMIKGRNGVWRVKK